MKVFLASDHAGFAMKQALLAHLPTLGYDVEDCGAFTLDPEDDYPDFIGPCAQKVVEAQAQGQEARGVVIGGSGQGEAMAANRIHGARAAVFYGPMRVSEILDREGGRSEDGFDCVRLPRRHNDANILSIGARFVGAFEADEAVRIFLETPFSGAERHTRRIGKF